MIKLTKSEAERILRVGAPCSMLNHEIQDDSIVIINIDFKKGICECSDGSIITFEIVEDDKKDTIHYEQNVLDMKSQQQKSEENFVNLTIASLMVIGLMIINEVVNVLDIPLPISILALALLIGEGIIHHILILHNR